MKQCRDCKEIKPLEQMQKHHLFKDGYNTLCLVCNRKRVKSWRKQNPEKRTLQQKRESKKDYNHNKHLKFAYGITIEDWQKMFEEQKGCCAICHRHQTEFQKRLFVDHDHATGKVRQLLCQQCNMTLGAARDDIEVLKNAIDYLLRHL